MKYGFDVSVMAHVYGEIEANSEEEAKEKISRNLRIYPKIIDLDYSESECEIDWEVKEKCHGNVCNFHGEGIALEEEENGN